MNVDSPHNNLDGGEYWLFGVTVVTMLCIQAAFLGLTRYWWVTAKRRRGREL